MRVILLFFVSILLLSAASSAGAQVIPVAPDRSGAALAEALNRDSILAVEVHKGLPAPIPVRVLYLTHYSASDSGSFAADLASRLEKAGYVRRVWREGADARRWIEILPCFQRECGDDESRTAAMRRIGYFFELAPVEISRPPA